MVGFGRGGVCIGGVVALRVLVHVVLHSLVLWPCCVVLFLYPSTRLRGAQGVCTGALFVCLFVCCLSCLFCSATRVGLKNPLVPANPALASIMNGSIGATTGLHGEDRVVTKWGDMDVTRPSLFMVHKTVLPKRCVGVVLLRCASAVRADATREDAAKRAIRERECGRERAEGLTEGDSGASAAGDSAAGAGEGKETQPGKVFNGT